MAILVTLLSIIIAVFVNSDAQTTICVWNAKPNNANGEYTLQSGTHNSRSYWKQEPTPRPTSAPYNCPKEPYYLFAVKTSTVDYWVFYSSLQQNYAYDHPYCSAQTTPTKPTECVNGWYIYDTTYPYWLSLPSTVTDGVCPSLSCDSIKISNTGDARCDNTFSADGNNRNSFIASNIYFFFSQYKFRWICHDDPDMVTECETIVGRFVSGVNPGYYNGWYHVNIGGSFTLALTNGYTALFECIGSTQTLSPTVSPTIRPTNKPTLNPTGKPTNKPTTNPTMRPTHKPTVNPTHPPSTQPTATPTLVPTVKPTNIPTKSPSTPSPTEPGQLSCGEDAVGSFSGEAITFYTAIPFAGDLSFDATESSFQVTTIEGYSTLGTTLGTDADHDEVLILTVPVGDYKFIMDGEQSGDYYVKIRCISDSPTPAPTSPPIPSLTNADTHFPTFNPTAAPSITGFPTLMPLADTDAAVTPTPRPIIVAPMDTVSILMTLIGVVLICCPCIIYLCCNYKSMRSSKKQHGGDDEMAAIMELGARQNIVMEQEEVASWLKYDVGLPQYYTAFVKNGYCSLRFIKEIEDKSQLEDIGITILGHQTMIWSQIKQLQVLKTSGTGTTLNTRNTTSMTQGNVAVVDDHEGEPDAQYECDELEQNVVVGGEFSHVDDHQLPYSPRADVVKDSISEHDHESMYCSVKKDEYLRLGVDTTGNEEDDDPNIVESLANYKTQGFIE